MNWTIPWGLIFLLIHIGLTAFITIRLLFQKRAIGAIFGWLIVVYVVPYVGVIGYMLIGEPRLGRSRHVRKNEMYEFYRVFNDQHLPDLAEKNSATLPLKQQGMSDLARNITGFSASDGNAMQLLNTTDSILNSMIADIHAAKDSCLLEFYIIEPAGRVGQLLEALMAASARGVNCKILADAVGSRHFFKTEWVSKLRNAGVHVTEALSVGLIKTFFVRSDLRNHRKILVVDNSVAYTGSFNLVDPKFFKQDSGVGEWVDVMMRCEGPVVEAMMAVFYADLAVENEDNLREVQDTLLTYTEDKNKAAYLTTHRAGDVVAQMIPSEPDEEHHVIYETIICAIHGAAKRVVITTPYFVPDETLLLALSTAAKRGVDVTLIMPKKIDSVLVRHATRAYFDLLLRDGVKLALFDGGLLHAKTVVIDDDYVLFGTVNIDMRSFFLNLEVSLAIYDAKITQMVSQQQEKYLEQCEYLKHERWAKRPHVRVLIENIVRLFSPLL